MIVNFSSGLEDDNKQALYIYWLFILWSSKHPLYDNDNVELIDIIVYSRYDLLILPECDGKNYNLLRYCLV